jgi:hypothetical protein
MSPVSFILLVYAAIALALLTPALAGVVVP